MSESLKRVAAITMFIDDTQRSQAFYEDVFGARAVYEDADAVVFEFENMAVNLLRVPAAHELIAPAPVGDADAPRRFQLTIGVQDTDAVCAQLAARGVELLNGPLGSRVGDAHRCLHRPGRPHLGRRRGRSLPEPTATPIAATEGWGQARPAPTPSLLLGELDAIDGSVGTCADDLELDARTGRLH